VLRVDRLDRPPAAQAELDHLPVALVPAGAQQPAILRLVGEEHPVLQPFTRPPPVDDGSRAARLDAGHARRERPHRRQRVVLAAVVHDDRRIALERPGRRGRGRGEDDERGRRCEPPGHGAAS
jgi:hypothetical protein